MTQWKGLKISLLNCSKVRVLLAMARDKMAKNRLMMLIERRPLKSFKKRECTIRSTMIWMIKLFREKLKIKEVRLQWKLLIKEIKLSRKIN